MQSKIGLTTYHLLHFSSALLKQSQISIPQLPDLKSDIAEALDWMLD